MVLIWFCLSRADGSEQKHPNHWPYPAAALLYNKRLAVFASFCLFL
jgi:hypothetical protein